MAPLTHGATADGVVSGAYSSWHYMKQRCLNPNHKAWKYYGARGITVCERWLDFKNFLEDMGERPDGLTLERKDNSLGYNKDNCVWATRRTQSNNIRTNHFLEFEGKIQTVAQWSREYRLNNGVILSRIKIGWTVARAITTPQKRKGEWCIAV